MTTTPTDIADPTGPVATTEPLAYDRLARTGRRRWWLTLVAVLAVPVADLGVIVMLFGGALVAAQVLGIAVNDNGTFAHPLLDEAVMLLAIAALIPLALVAAPLIQRRPAGSLHSVTGRLRLRWLGRCALVALVLVGVAQGIDLVLGGGAGRPAVGTGFLVTALVMYLVLVPLQAAGEEYLFRGWLLQAIGVYRKGRWPAVAVSALLFAAAHGWGGPWGFGTLVVTGVCLALVTIRTGGLEASIALHAVNNTLAFAFGAWVGAAGSLETAADASPWQAVSFAAVNVVYLVVVAWLAKRRGVRVRHVDRPGCVA